MTDAAQEPRPLETTDAIACRDIGRMFSDPPDRNPRFDLRPAPRLPWTNWPTVFTVTVGGISHSEIINHPHLALLRLLRDCPFETVIDIGCGEGSEIKLMRHLGKQAFAVNFDPLCSFEPDYFGDFLTLNLEKRYDAVWCSHVLEHIRNPGAFLDKIFDILVEGGWLAISVPYHEFGGIYNGINIGHHNRYNVLLLCYQLICAGFDCGSKYFSSIVHNGQISILLRKKSNLLERSNFATYSRIASFMPIPAANDQFYTCPPEINWPIPLGNSVDGNAQ